MKNLTLCGATVDEAMISDATVEVTMLLPLTLFNKSAHSDSNSSIVCPSAVINGLKKCFGIACYFGVF